MKRTVLLIISLICLFSAFTIWVSSSGAPPRDAEAVRQFNDHRSAFEKLSKMLQEDGSIVQVDNQGIFTTNRTQVSALTPGEIGFPKERSEDYLATLKMTGACLARHKEGEYFFPVKSWRFGRAGWDIAIVHRDVEPTNQVASLDEFRGGPGNAYRHIVGSWYLWKREY